MKIKMVSLMIPGMSLQEVNLVKLVISAIMRLLILNPPPLTEMLHGRIIRVIPV
ncbi:hypothetical protein D3C85_1501340 [compost metagenome]